MSDFKLLQRGLLTVSAVGVVVIVGLVAQQASNFGDVADPVHWRIEADISLTGFKLDQVGVDGMELRLTADNAKLLEKNQRLDATGLNLEVFKKGVSALTLSADTGTLDLRDGTITVVGNDRPATLSVADGPTVTAPAMTWQPALREVTTDGRATVASQGLVATGDTAIASLADETVRMRGNVTVTWQQ
jgi:LPS export ABC transporter protein LptC